MANTPEDKIETTFDSVPSMEMLLSQRMDKLSERMDSFDRRVEHLEELMEKVVRHIAVLVDHQETLVDNQRSISSSMGRLTGEILPPLTEKQASTYAAMDRFERIVDYLLRCNEK